MDKHLGFSIRKLGSDLGVIYRLQIYLDKVEHNELRCRKQFSETTHIHSNFLWKDEDICGLNKSSILIIAFMALHMNNFSWILFVYEYYFIEKLTRSANI